MIHDKIEVNNDILKKALNIIEIRKYQKHYINKCIEAIICPICGNNLISREITREEEKRSNYDYFNNVLECEKNHFKHITGGYDSDCD